MSEGSRFGSLIFARCALFFSAIFRRESLREMSVPADLEAVRKAPSDSCSEFLCKALTGQQAVASVDIVVVCEVNLRCQSDPLIHIISGREASGVRQPLTLESAQFFFVAVLVHASCATAARACT
jgi:hypothetical protein